MSCGGHPFCCQTHLNTIPSNTMCPSISVQGWRGFPSGVRKLPRAEGQGIPSVLAWEMKQCIPNCHSKDKPEELVPKGESPACPLFRQRKKKKEMKPDGWLHCQKQELWKVSWKNGSEITRPAAFAWEPCSVSGTPMAHNCL